MKIERSERDERLLRNRSSVSAAEGSRGGAVGFSPPSLSRRPESEATRVRSSRERRRAKAHRSTDTASGGPAGFFGSMAAPRAVPRLRRTRGAGAMDCGGRRRRFPCLRCHKWLSVVGDADDRSRLDNATHAQVTRAVEDGARSIGPALQAGHDATATNVKPAKRATEQRSIYSVARFAGSWCFGTCRTRSEDRSDPRR